MTDPLRFHPQVPRDVADAIGWYEEISKDLANRLRAAIRDAFARIRNEPLTYGILFDDVRLVRVSGSETRPAWVVSHRFGERTLSGMRGRDDSAKHAREAKLA